MACKFVAVSTSVMSYDPLSHSRHNTGDRSAMVGHALCQGMNSVREIM